MEAAGRRYALRQVAEYLGGRVHGDANAKVLRLSRLEDSGPDDICVAYGPMALERVEQSKATAVVVAESFPDLDRNLIRVRNPRRAFAALMHWFHPAPRRQYQVDSRAVVSPEAQLATEVAIGPGSVVEAGAVIGERVVIHAGVHVGAGCRIGEESEIFPNVTLYPGVTIGKRVRIHAGTVIGSDGFGYLAGEGGRPEKIPQAGSVEIEDDVEIGANCAIDRATIGKTLIRAGTKIDNLVQVGHNTLIGRGCLIAGQVGISGSVEIGNHCVLAGQVGIKDHVKLTDKVIVGGQSGVVRDLCEGTWLGTPAVQVTEALRVYHLLPKLPELHREIQELRRRVKELEEDVRKAASS